MPEISERTFEDAIECGLLSNGPDACAGDTTTVRETPLVYGEGPPGGYRRRAPEEYDRSLCLLPRDVIDFVRTTQPREWAKLEQHHGAAVKERFLARLSKAGGAATGTRPTPSMATRARFKAGRSSAPRKSAKGSSSTATTIAS